MTVKRLSSEDKTSTLESAPTNKVKEGGRSEKKVWYAYPTRSIAHAVPRLELKPFEIRAFSQTDRVIESEGKITQDKAFEIFKKHAEISHEITSEDSLKRRMGDIFRRYVRTGRYIRMEETPQGEIAVSDSSVLIPKVRYFQRTWGEEHWKFVIELQKKFGMNEKKANDVASGYPQEKRDALLVLKSFLPAASFEGLDLLLKYSSVEERYKLLRRPTDLKEFLDTVHANMFKSLEGILQKVSKECLRKFISRTPLDELPELVKVIKQRFEEVRKFNDEEFAGFRLEEERRIAARESNA